jgi:hypothetical protein
MAVFSSLFRTMADRLTKKPQEPQAMQGAMGANSAAAMLASGAGVMDPAKQAMEQEKKKRTFSAQLGGAAANALTKGLL